ncbi:MAG: wax ester/triacylglycerol synthase domain-containing protein, partial [Pseudonocardiaceae bacterium]
MRLTGLDTAFLCLDRDVTPMHLGALAVFRPAHHDGPVRMVAVLAERAQRLPLLHRRVQPARFLPAAATWADDPEFRAQDHIRLHRLSGQGCLDEAGALAAELMRRPLPPHRPLWEFHVISGLSAGRIAVLFKMHHALGDGLSVREIGMRMLDEVSLHHGGAGSSRVNLRSAPRPAEPSTLSWLWRVPGDACEAVGSVVERLTEATGIAHSVLRSVRLPALGSPLVISSSCRRALATAVLDLTQIRRIRAHYGGTVNDVLLAVVAGGLREWLL